MEANMETTIVIDGLPSNVSPAKKEIFKKMLDRKVATELGHTNFTTRLLDGDDGFVIGAFVDCKTVAEADRALSKLHKCRLTKTDVFIANRWSDFEKMFEVPDEYVPPGEGDDNDNDNDNDDDNNDFAADVDMTNPFMHDERARPQVLIKAGETYDCTWHWYNTDTTSLNTIRAPKHGDKHDSALQWSQMDRRAKALQKGLPLPLPMWSPNGTYLLTQHPEGIKVWGGMNMRELVSLQVQELQYFHVSPSERYATTYGREFEFWNLALGKVIRALPGEVARPSEWPTYKYNADDSIVARMDTAKGHLYAYESETMKLIAQELPPRYTLAVSQDQGEKFCSFAWSPTRPDVIAYVVEGDGTRMGHRIQIDKLTVDAGDDETPPMCDLSSLARRNFFQVDKIDLLWHPDGSMLAAKIEKTKNNKTVTEFCIFRVGASKTSHELFEPKGIPVRFAWHPSAPRFAVLLEPTGNASNQLAGTGASALTGGASGQPHVAMTAKKQSLGFYEALPNNGFADRGTFPCEAERIYWAPKGSRCVAINFEKSRLDFYGIPGAGPFVPPNAKMSFLATGEHVCLTHAAWDPTGRFFCTYLSSLVRELDNSYKIWNVNGQCVTEKKQPRISHINWRPLAKPMLDAHDYAQIKKDLPKKSKEYTARLIAERAKEDEATAKAHAAKEASYVALMDQIRAHHVKERTAETRAELIASAPSMKRALAKCDAAPKIKEMKEVAADEE